MTSLFSKRNRELVPILCGLVILIIAYVIRYHGYIGTPGNDLSHPLGWWQWADQIRYRQSTAAFAGGDLSSGQHWYALGYPLLGVPFYELGPQHPFYVVDLACLLLAYCGYVAFCRRVGVSVLVAVALFLITNVSDHSVFLEWIIPWNTSPSGALIWLLLAVGAACFSGIRRPFLLGLLLGLVPIFRPADIVIALPCCLFPLVYEFRAGGRSKGSFGLRMLAGFLLPVAAYLLLYLSIYGVHLTRYMQDSSVVGFSLHDFGWKAYVLMLDPAPWFTEGEGLLQRVPWLIFGIAGLLPAFLQRAGKEKYAATLLASVVAIHALLYISYVDMLPTGLWRYNNLHYWAWIFPGYFLLGWLMLRDLAMGPRRWIAGLSLAATALLLCIHINPVQVPSGTPAKMLHFSGGPGNLSGTYYGSLHLRDRAGILENFANMRVIPVAGGFRVIALTRAIIGPVQWVPGFVPYGLTDTVPEYFAMSVSLGKPCWLLRCPPYDVVVMNPDFPRY